VSDAHAGKGLRWEEGASDLGGWSVSENWCLRFSEDKAIDSLKMKGRFNDEMGCQKIGGSVFRWIRLTCVFWEVVC